MQFRVLGPLEVDAGDGPVPLGGPKQRTVLANLLVHPNEVVPADTLIEEIWGEEPPGQARNTLQTYVSNLRKSLGEGLLVGRAPGYVLVVDPIDVDATRFDALVREARRTLPVDPATAIDTLEDALAMWRGPALADVADRSLLAEAARLDELRLEAQEERIGALLALGSAARAIAELEPLLAHHPLRERLWEQLMLALYRDGRQADALGAFQRAREVLADELGIDPSPELVRLQGQILAQDPTLELRGEPLRGYRLLEKLGETRSGTRFRAIQPRVERDVEVEVFREDVAGTTAFVERFEREARAVAALEHPHIVPIYDHWREPGRAYVVRRYLRGSSLRARLERGETLDPDEALLVIEQVAAGLSLAHGRGVAHGPLDEDCIWFDGEQNAYLGGFVIGAGAPPSTDEDLRDLGALARRLLGSSVPGPLAPLLDRADGDDQPSASSWGEAARSALAGTTWSPPDADEAVRNPYRGLRPFEETDAPDFFGRAAAVRRVVERLGEARFLALVGPSGCGKSSLVRAGVVPALRRGGSSEAGVLVTELSPGSHPFDELEAALGGIAVQSIPRLGDLLQRSSRGLLDAVDRAAPAEAQVVVLIDQFEELFTHTASEAERAGFLECLRVACVDPESRVRVVVTLRADFYDRPLVYPRFGELLARRTETVPPLQPDELEQAIRGPAARVGVAQEPGLVADMIADAAHQPGALPLIQFALTELFDRRTADGMTLETYRALGGVVGTLATSADDAVRRAPPEQRRAIRQVFLRLVTLGEGRSDTRRRVARSSLDQLDLEPSAVDEILDAFGRLRILTFDRDGATREPTVEIAHEALLDAWPRLRGWIEEAREDLRQERALARSAREWAAAEEDPSFLLRGARLEQASTWLRATDLAVDLEVRRYVVASSAQREREERVESERRDRETAVERRATRRLRGLVAVFATAALVAGSLTIVATQQGRRADREAAIANVRELAAASVSSLSEDPERAVLLAIEAVERSRADTGAPLPQALEALHQAIAASRIVATVPDAIGPVATAPDGRIAAQDASRPGRLVILSSAGAVERQVDAHDGELTGVAFSPTVGIVITAGSDGWLRAWTNDGALVWERHGEGPARGVSTDARGSLVATRWPAAGRVVVADVATGRSVRTFGGLDPEVESPVAVSPGGTRIAMVTGVPDGFETGTITPLFGDGPHVTFRATQWRGINGELSWSPDGRLVSGSSYVWRTDTGSLVHKAWAHDQLVVTSAWSPDGRLATGSIDGEAEVWDLGSGEFRTSHVLPAASDPTTFSDIAFTADGARIVTAGTAVRILDVGPLGDAEVASLVVPTVWSGQVAYDPTGSELVLVADRHGDVTGLRSWELASSSSDPLGPSLKLPNAPFQMNPVDGSILLRRESGRLLHVTQDGARPLPLEADFAAWVPDGHVVLANDDIVSLVDLEGREIWRTTVPLSVGSLSVGSDRIAVASGDADGSAVVPVLRVGDGSVVSTIPTHADGAWLDPRGDVVVTQQQFVPIEIWEADSARRIGTIDAGLGGPLAFAPDGSTLATLGDDNVVRLVDLSTQEILLTLPPPERDLAHEFCYGSALAFSPDGSHLAVQRCDGIRMLTLVTDELLAIARADVTRSLTADECRHFLHAQTCSS